MPNYLSIDGIQTSGYLPYIFGDLASGTFPGTVITDKICDIDFASMEFQDDISLNEIHYTVSPVEYVVDGNRYYVLGNARFAFGPDIATDTGEQFAIVVDADAYDSHASTISRKLYIGFLEADDSAEPIDAISLENSEEEGVDTTVTRRSAPNTYIFEVDGATSLDTTITKSYGSEMIVHIDSVQEGSGTPSSSNIRPIDGWTGAVISGTNINEQSAYAIDWADSVGTVYGGTLNVNTGLLTITHACINSYNGESLTGRWISSMDTYSSGTTPTIGSQVVYELSSPIKQYIFISNEGQYLELQNPTSNTGAVDIIDYPDEIYTIGTSDADNPLIRRRAVKITGTTGAVIIGNGTLLSLSDYPSYTPVDTGEDFAVLIPDVYATEDSSGEIPATVAISSSFASAMTSEFAIQIIHSGLDRFHTFNVDDYSDYESGETGSLYRMLNEYGQAGPIPDIDDSKYDEALHGQNIVANTILAQQIDVRDLMAQDLSVTGKIHSSNKTSATDNNEGFFLGYEPINGVTRATFGVGASDNAHIIYTGTSLDIKTNWLKFDEGTETVTIGRIDTPRIKLDGQSMTLNDSYDSSYFTVGDMRTDGYYQFTNTNPDTVVCTSTYSIYASYKIDTTKPVTLLDSSGNAVDYENIYPGTGTDGRDVSYFSNLGGTYPDFKVGKKYKIIYTTKDPIYKMQFASNSRAYGANSICLAINGRTRGKSSFAIGVGTIASGDYSFASNMASQATGENSFATGHETKAIGRNSASFGEDTEAAEYMSFATGNNTTANGYMSATFGYGTETNGDGSIAEGRGTIATGNYSHVMGKYNIEDNNNEYALIIGNGTDIDLRSNALTVDWNGTTKSFGHFLSQQSDITIGTTPSSSQYLRAFGLMDSAGYLYADVQHTYLSDSYSGMTFCVNRDVNGTTKQNFFRILLGADGTNSIRFSDSEAWRKGLGVNIKTLSQNITTDQYGQCKVPSSLSGKTILSIRTGNYQYGAFLIGSTDIRVFKISVTPLAWAASTSVPLIFVYID